MQREESLDRANDSLDKREHQLSELSRASSTAAKNDLDAL
jgi:hypothetical protein